MNSFDWPLAPMIWTENSPRRWLRVLGVLVVPFWFIIGAFAWMFVDATKGAIFCIKRAWRHE